MNNPLTKINGEWFASHRPKALHFFVGLILVVLFVVGFQKYCDKRTEQREDERIKKYDAEVDEKMQVFQNYIEMANRDHQTTTAILDAMQTMTKNIKVLAKNDIVITERVKAISENEYKAARGQKNNQAAVNSRTSKPGKPLRAREADALKIDRELYPTN